MVNINSKSSVRKASSKAPEVFRENDQKKKRKPSQETKKKTVSKNKERKRSINNMDVLSMPFTPLPYRITIKLSGANQSAPAETVTKALRKAGVSFEVEKIERIQLQPSIKATSLRGNRR